MANFDPAERLADVRPRWFVEEPRVGQPNNKNFGPRFGVSYSPDQKTVFRGGYGIYYTLFERFGSEDELAVNPPFLINKELASNASPVLTPAIGFPSNFLDPWTVNFNALSRFTSALHPTAPEPCVQQWSFGFQRQISSWLRKSTMSGPNPPIWM